MFTFVDVRYEAETELALKQYIHIAVVGAIEWTLAALRTQRAGMCQNKQKNATMNRNEMAHVQRAVANNDKNFPDVQSVIKTGQRHARNEMA